ncbi:MAG: flagellar filament capping protein FliD [Firmicutes bacterium]|nr:flagellar filament capping protein FliD [Bacillota bacterium]
MATSLSFQGVTSGLQTDKLIQAIMDRDGVGVQRLRDRQELNTKRAEALRSMRSALVGLGLSASSLQDRLKGKSITSSDANNTYVTATGTGTVQGAFEVKVSSIATQGRLGPLTVEDPLNPGQQVPALVMDDPNRAIVTGGAGEFAVTGTDGVTKTFTLTNNSLNGLRDAINASGAGVTASIVNTGKGANPYQLVVTAKETGAGVTGGVVTLATRNGTTVQSSLGVTEAGLSSTGTGIGQNAVFSVNGVDMVRQSNTVKDAVDGLTFTLKKGSPDNVTTLTVASDKSGAATAVQDLLTKYNDIVKAYKTASTSTKDTDGGIIAAPLAGDGVARSIMNEMRQVMGGLVDGLDSSSPFRSGADVGIKRAADGTLSLDTRVFNEAMDKDPEAVKRVFALAGNSTLGSVSLAGGSEKTATGPVGFNVTYAVGGAVSGSLTYGGQTYNNLTGTNGMLNGPAGSPLEGLQIAVSGSGSGTLTISRGIGQKLDDLISSLTSYSGSIERARTRLDDQNRSLAARIEAGQAILDKRQAALTAQFDKMAYTIRQMRTAAGGLSGLG